MPQAQHVLPGEPSTSASASVVEEQVYLATDLVAQLARVRPREDLTEYNATRHKASKELMGLGIARSHFGTLVTSFNHGGGGGIRGFLERHFASWNGEPAPIES